MNIRHMLTELGTITRASIWTLTAITGTVATTGGTTLTLSADGTVASGQTIRLDSEEMLVTALGTKSATVTRGVNGTTKVVHTDAVISTKTVDSHGKPSETWSTVASAVPCLITGQAGAQQFGIVETDVHARYAFFEADANCVKGDRLAVDSRTFNVLSIEPDYAGRAVFAYANVEEVMG